MVNEKKQTKNKNRNENSGELCVLMVRHGTVGVFWDLGVGVGLIMQCVVRKKSRKK